jgi:hypothetical protein
MCPCFATAVLEETKRALKTKVNDVADGKFKKMSTECRDRGFGLVCPIASSGMSDSPSVRSVGRHDSLASTIKPANFNLTGLYSRCHRRRTQHDSPPLVNSLLRFPADVLLTPGLLDYICRLRVFCPGRSTTAPGSSERSARTQMSHCRREE